MVWTIAIPDSMRDRIVELCQDKGLIRGHDPAILARRFLSERIDLEIEDLHDKQFIERNNLINEDRL